jgi:hypothetical protein
VAHIAGLRRRERWAGKDVAELGAALHWRLQVTASANVPSVLGRLRLAARAYRWAVGLRRARPLVKGWIKFVACALARLPGRGRGSLAR